MLDDRKMTVAVSATWARKNIIFVTDDVHALHAHTHIAACSRLPYIRHATKITRIDAGGPRDNTSGADFSAESVESYRTASAGGRMGGRGEEEERSGRQRSTSLTTALARFSFSSMRDSNCAVISLRPLARKMSVKERREDTRRRVRTCAYSPYRAYTPRA